MPRGIEGKYIQWKAILRDILNGKLKTIQKCFWKTETESESEEGELEDQDEFDFEMENTDTFKKTDTNQYILTPKMNCTFTLTANVNLVRLKIKR